MAIKRVQQMGVYGITTGHPEEREQEMVCCPELDRDGHGRPNLLKASCLYRQQDHEWKIPTCYGGCKGKRPNYTPPASEEQRRARAKRSRERGKSLEAEAIRLKIIELNGKGWGVDAIAEEVGRGRSLVEKRMQEAGLVVPREAKPISLKQQVMQWLDENPGSTTKDVMKAFCGTPRGTCESYRVQWNRRRRDATL